MFVCIEQWKEIEMRLATGKDFYKNNATNRTMLLLASLDCILFTAVGQVKCHSLSWNTFSGKPENKSNVWDYHSTLAVQG